MTRGRFDDITGKRFGRWTVKAYCGNGKWLCECDCGTVREVFGDGLKSGRTKSCGCLSREMLVKRLTKHGECHSRLYGVWLDMRDRCSNPNASGYKHYGGSGVRVCNEWQSFEVFREWAYSTGYDPTAKRGLCTLDRIDPYGNYEPSNCRWVDMSVQNSNRKPYRRPKLFKAVELIDVNGAVVSRFNSIRDAARACDVDPSSISKVCKGKMSSIHGLRWRYAEGSQSVVQTENAG